MKLRAVIVVSSVLLAAACHRQPAVSRADAQSLLRTLEALSPEPPEEETWRRLQMALCSELPSCAEGHERELQAAAGADLDDSQRAVILAQGFADWRAAHDSGVDFHTWWRRRFAAYVERARAATPPEERAKLDAARARLGLGGAPAGR